MTKETAELILDAYKEIDDQEEGNICIHPTYSGRGMYGRTTHAVSGNRGMIMRAVVRAAYKLGYDRVDIETGFEEDIKDLRWDQLGRDEICY